MDSQEKEKKIRNITKHIVMMKIACDISKLSYDPKHKVGSILVKNDYTDINAIGYNGSYAGGKNSRESLESGESGFIHAEANLLIHSTLNRDTVKDYTVFLTLKPCINCAKMLINKGVKRIVILEDYINSDSEKLLRSVNIEVVFLKDYFTNNMFSIIGNGKVDISNFDISYINLISMFFEDKRYIEIPVDISYHNFFEKMFEQLWDIW
jgi:dCMP deaminase